MGMSSGLQALPLPLAIIGARVEHAVVQAGGAALPEFDAIGNHAVTAPMFRAGRMVPELLLACFVLLFQRLAAGDGPALLRGDRAELSGQGATL